MKCPYCKGSITNDAKFCTNCGKQLHANDSEDTKRLTIGRIADNDIVLNYPQVSSRHAILLRKENQWYIKDRNSTNGTFVNDRSKRISESPVNLEDLLFFGSYKIKASRLIQLKKNTVLGTQDYNRLQIVSDTTLIGRDPDADIHLDYPQISWHHVQLSRKGNQILLKDLGSTNGTFVNGKRISSCEVKPNDVISLGSYRFQVTHDQKLSQHDFRGDIRIDADNITVSIKKKTILDNISFSVFPTEFVGLMGFSGAGKTTLLMALNGYLKPTVGFSKINGESLYQKYDEFRQHIGYVPQDDIIHPELTVYEALYYTARLRLPRDIKNKEIKERINTVLKRLGLFDPDMLNQKGYIDIRDVQIGSPEKKGISGGQRKRVNLAMELLTEPSILFLDEPTSGLSSPDTLEVIKTLREIADQGKTIILTIHQPGLDAYRLMDNVIVVSAGKMAYYGPAYPDALEFFNEQEKDKALKSADSLLAGLKAGEEDLNINWPQKYQKSKAHQMYVDGRKSEPCNTNKIEKPKLTKGLRQLSILSSRYFRIKMKDYINTAILLLQAPIIAFLITVVFFDSNNPSYLPVYLIIISALWFGTSNASREIVAEKAIYIRERMVNLKIPSYVLSKFVILSILCIIQCIILVGVIHTFLELSGDILIHLLISICAAFIGIGIGLLLSALSKTQQAAVAIVPIVLLPMIILGGGLVFPSNMNDTSIGLSYFMPSRWAFELATHVEKENDYSNCSESVCQTDPKCLCQPDPQCWSVNQLFGSHETEDEVLYFILIVYILILLSLTMIVLRTKDRL